MYSIYVYREALLAHQICIAYRLLMNILLTLISILWFRVYYPLIPSCFATSIANFIYVRNYIDLISLIPFMVNRTLGWTASRFTQIRACAANWGGHRCCGRHPPRRRSGDHATFPQNQCTTHHRWPGCRWRCAAGHPKCRYVRSKCVGSAGHWARFGKLLCDCTNGIGRQCCNFPWYRTHACRRRVQVSAAKPEYFRVWNFV